jgi:hypothetical protein
VRQAPLESPGTQDAPAGRVAPRPSPPPPPLPGAKPRQHGAWLVTLPWLIAAVGWLVAALFLVYSHGQSDRLRITRQDDRVAAGKLTLSLTQALIVQHFAATLGVHAVALLPPTGGAGGTLLYIPGYLHGALVIRGLPVPATGQVYALWAQSRSGALTLLGTLAPAEKGAETAAVVEGPMALDAYRSVAVTGSRVANPQSPLGPVLLRGSFGASPLAAAGRPTT